MRTSALSVEHIPALTDNWPIHKNRELLGRIPFPRMPILYLGELSVQDASSALMDVAIVAASTPRRIFNLRESMDSPVTDIGGHKSYYQTILEDEDKLYVHGFQLALLEALERSEGSVGNPAADPHLVYKACQPMPASLRHWDDVCIVEHVIVMDDASPNHLRVVDRFALSTRPQESDYETAA